MNKIIELFKVHMKEQNISEADALDMFGIRDEEVGEEKPIDIIEGIIDCMPLDHFYKVIRG